MFELSDIVAEIEAIKQDPKYASHLGYYDSSSGVTPIVNKLSYGLREKWVTQASKYKQTHDVPFPPFSFFVKFLRDIRKIRNDPSLSYDTFESTRTFVKKSVSRKTEVDSSTQSCCPIYKINHRLNQCRVFRSKSFEERKKCLKDNNYCFKCCNSSDHKSKQCQVKVQCSVCNSSKHPAAMHVDTFGKWSMPQPALPSQDRGRDLVSHSFRPSHGEEQAAGSLPPVLSQDGERHVPRNEQVASKCTQICGNSFQANHVQSTS